MKIKTLGLLVFLISLLALADYTPLTSNAKENRENNKEGTETTSEANEIPEKNGDYPEPGNKRVRVRVFVHQPKDSLSAAASCEDPDSEAVVHKTNWKLPAGSWIYNLNSSSVPSSVGQSNLATIVGSSFEKWQEAQNKVSFNRGNNTSKTKSSFDRLNIIAWGRTSGQALAVTYIRYYTSTGLVVDVDTIMNKKYPWSWTAYLPGLCGKSNSYDAQAVLTHEEGHWLGLDDEYEASYFNNTMYGIGYKGDLKSDTLTIGDKNGVAAIYP